MKCRYEHDDDCCNAGADQYMCKCKKPCGFIWPLSNADHIRSMTDGELAKFHLLECPYMAEVYGECKYGWHDREQTCEECMLDWLKQPYEEENHGKA